MEPLASDESVKYNYSKNNEITTLKHFYIHIKIINIPLFGFILLYVRFHRTYKVIKHVLFNVT